MAAVGLSSAAPEADPAFAYSVGAPLVYTHAVHAPVVYSAAVHHPLVYAAAGCRNDAGALVPCAQGVLPYVTLPAVAAAAAEEPAAEEAAAVVEARKKREADADPAILASSTVVKNPAPVVQYVAAHPYAAYGLYGYPYAAYHGAYPYLYGRKKREAEADATADAEADPWLVYGYPYAYNHAFLHPYAYALGAGCRNYLGALVPCAGRR